MKLPSSYNPAEYEEKIYALWEKSQAFVPKNRGGKGYFSLVVPPPNANADLHMGHALTAAVEDILARYHRMQGQPTLFVPGADHAGFETQVVYEKHLAKEGKSRFDFSRDELYKRIWDFVAGNRHNFERQFRAFGVSVDWNRFSFTLDNKVVMRTYETFKRMWDDGLIYRGTRIVNFCTFHGTSFADIEVVHEEQQTKLWRIAYPLEDGGGELVIATTRPETKLGQSALMVHPDDERYRGFIGKRVLQPLVPDAPIPVVGDENVDKDFGTGVVTVTPAHDPKDFEVARRHRLPLIELITPEGKMSQRVPKAFRDLPVTEARAAVVAALDEAGYLRGEEDHTHSVAKCYKCGTTIEPLAREQWFVNMEPLAKKAVAALKHNKIAFYPDSKRWQLIRYLEGLRDWNISRQIAWGIPIPAFQNTEDPDDWIFDTGVSQQTIERGGQTYRRDPDVFDTWFSSAQWPFVTLDYPDGQDYRHFYPLSLMETGGDILYPWVSRMIMVGQYVTGKLPFEAVYLHGYVMAEDGRRMSKSVGNVIDPLEAIKSYGSDALRMGIVAGRVAAVNRGYDQRRVEEARNFTNKLWNIARFTEGVIGDNHGLRAEPKPTTHADHWILSRLAETQRALHGELAGYRVGEAYEVLYHFIWDDLADWYVEASKVELNSSVLAYVLETALKIAHPYAPFVTETIWQTLAWEDGSLLAVQRWPQPAAFDAQRAGEFVEVRAIVSEVRRIVSELQAGKPTLYYTEVPFLAANAGLITQLARISGVQQVRAGRGLHLTKTRFSCWLDIDRHTAQRYLDHLKVEQDRQAAAVEQLRERLANKAYVDKAPKEVVEQSRRQLNEQEQLLASINAQVEDFMGATKDLK